MKKTLLIVASLSLVILLCGCMKNISKRDKDDAIIYNNNKYENV